MVDRRVRGEVGSTRCLLRSRPATLMTIMMQLCEVP
jgi:hypothetical protein